MPGRSTPRGAIAAALCALVLLPSAALAVSPSFWRTDTASSFLDGELDGTSVRHDGAVVLSPPFEREAVPDSRYAWAAVRGRDGSFYVIGGTPGRLYRLRDGEFTILFETETSDIASIAIGDGGDVFVGTAPGGEVYRVDGDGTEELFFDTGEDYVWSLAHSPEHGLMVGTGDAAKVFAVDEDGDGELVCELEESSVIALAAFDGRVIAGTAGEGLVIDVTPGRDLRVIYDTPHEEIPGIAPAPDGRLYFAGTSIAFEQAFEENGELGVGLGEGAVYISTPAGSAVELWRSSESPITALGPGPDGAVWVGTGSHGLIFSITPTGDTDLVASLDEEEILSISSTGEGLVVTTGASAAVYVVGSGTAPSGAYESDVLDANTSAIWGEASWEAVLPSGSSLALSTRSGHAVEPDDLWSKWAPVEGDAAGAIASPPARFLQWRVELGQGSGGESPVLRSVGIAFLRENLPPRLGAVTVYDPDETGTSGGGEGAVRQSLPSGVEVTFSLDPPTSTMHELPVMLRGVRTVEWEAIDPNQDRLSFSLWIRGEDEEDWKLVEDDLERTVHTWDTQSMTDGTYRARVVVTDRPDNTEEQALSDERASAPFVVDNTAPTIGRVELELEGGVLRVEGAVEDERSPVTRVAVAVDYGEWKPAFAGDGMFDGRSETFHLTLTDLTKGEHAVSVRAIDRAGNIAVSRKILR